LDFWVSKHADNIAKVHLENKTPKFLAMSMWQPTVPWFEPTNEITLKTQLHAMKTTVATQLKLILAA
jgi:hypothetical protein